MSYPYNTETAQDEPLLLPVKEEVETSSLPSSPPQMNLFKGQIILNPGISIVNFITFVLFSAFIGMFLVPLGLLAMPLLSVVYNFSQSERVDISSIAQLIQLGLKFLTAPFIGYIVDKYGRKPMMLFGLVLVNLSIVALPNLGSNPYLYYIIVSCILDFGIACLIMAPLLADYIDNRTKGRMAGLGGVMVFAASFSVTYLNEDMDMKNNIGLKYYELAGIGAFMFLLIAIGIKGGLYHKKQWNSTSSVPEGTLRLAQTISERRTDDCDDENLRGSMGGPFRINGSTILQGDLQRNEGLVNEQRPANPQGEQLSIAVGFKQMKNPWILTGYIASMMSFACLMLPSAILSNYVLAVTKDETSDQAIVLANKQLLTAMFASIVFGFSADKLNKFLLIVLVTIDSIAATVLLLLAPTPFHPLAYASMVGYGIATAGFVTLAQQVLSKYPDPKFRASVAAVGGMFSTSGGAVTSILGMYLMQYDARMPFFLYVGLAGIGLGVLTVLYIAKREVLSKS